MVIVARRVTHPASRAPPVAAIPATTRTRALGSAASATSATAAVGPATRRPYASGAGRRSSTHSVQARSKGAIIAIDTATVRSASAGAPRASRGERKSAVVTGGTSAAMVEAALRPVR